MTPEKFARCLIGLKLPLTEEEWYGLVNLLERLQPGIGDCLDVDSIKKRNGMKENWEHGNVILHINKEGKTEINPNTICKGGTWSLKEKDCCVLCGKETKYYKDTHIDLRENYVDGAGQLCDNCSDNI